MKSYTDIEQSKKLTEILPLESADGYWDFQIDGYNLIADKLGYYKNDSEIPCWSLAALLNSVKYNTINLHYNDVRNDWIASCTVEHSTRYGSGRALNPVDACVEMILKLHEQKLL